MNSDGKSLIFISTILCWPSTLKRRSQQDAQAAILACDCSRLLNASWQSIVSSCPMGLPIKFEMQFHMTDPSKSGCNLSLNIATRICWTTIEISQCQCWILVKMFTKKFNSWFIEINFFIEGSSNRPYLCRNCHLIFCQMFMTLFSYDIHESCFFLRGEQLIFSFVCSRINWLSLTFLFRKERLSVFFVFSGIFFIYLSFLIRREWLAIFVLCSSIILFKLVSIFRWKRLLFLSMCISFSI